MHCYKINIISIFILLALFIPILVKITNKNSCSSYFDYLLINFGGNCYYNPDVELSVPQLIEKYSGKLRTYKLTTDDGYILTMFRIFHENSIGAILLQPPISAGSIAYLSDGNESFAFTLWRQGYDVWLSNHRGASYSRQHVNLSTSDALFWNYGFHEIAIYDLDVEFDMIKKETNGSKITYVGYSLGANVALIYASLKPEKAEEIIERLILMGPTILFNNFTSPFKLVMYFMHTFKSFLGFGEMCTFETIRTLLAPVTIVPYISNYLTATIMGWSPDEMDPVLFPYIFAHHGRGISNTMIYHFQQISAKNSNFSMYDYGKKTNMLLYGTFSPPDYPLQNVAVPIYIIHGEKDKISTQLDVKNLCDRALSKKHVKGKILIPNYNHVDFFFSRHRKEKTFKTIFNILKKN